MSDTFDLQDKPYKLVFKDISGYMEDCKYCGLRQCSGCNVPYSEEATVTTILGNLKLTANDSLFADDRRVSGKEFQVEIVWHQDIDAQLFSFLSTAIPLNVENQDASAEKDYAVQLTDCLKEFKQMETLDADNMWYCNKCKEHV